MPAISSATVFLLVLAVVFVVNSVVVIPANHAAAVVRLGRFLKTVRSGVHFRIPFIDMVKKVDLNQKIPGWNGLSAKAFDAAIEAAVMGTPARPTQTPPKSPTASVTSASPDVQKIASWLLATASTETGIDLKGDPIAQTRITEAVQNALQELQLADSCDISLPFIAADQRGPKHFMYSLNSSQVKQIVSGS